MKRRTSFLRALLIALGILVLPALAISQEPTDQIAAEIARVAKALESIPRDNPDWKQLEPYITSSLAGAREALKAGHPYTALEDLERASTNLTGGQAAMGAAAPAQRGPEAFEIEWRRSDADLKSLEKRYREGNWPSTPLAVQALAQADRARTQVFYNSSRAFAAATEPKYGYYYLGLAKGAAEFALFCQSLKFATGSPPPTLHSVAPEIRDLEKKIIAAYQPPYSIDHHGEFIRIHSALKEAGDLEAAHLYAGALLKYLESLQLFETLAVPVPGVGEASALRNKLSQARQRLSEGNADYSIAQAFLERVESSLDADPSKPEFTKGLQTAQVILDKVIPAYDEALVRTDAAVLPSPARTVTVTLVRWPYT